MVSESGLDFKGHRSDPRRAGGCLVVVAGRGFDMNPTCEVLYKPTIYPQALCGSVDLGFSRL